MKNPSSTWTRDSVWAITVFWIVGLSALSPLNAQQINFTRIANTDTVNPGGSPDGQPQGTLTNFGRPLLAGQTAWFRARVRLSDTTSTDGGFFRGDGGPITAVVDVFTEVPDGTGSFRSLHSPALHNGQLAFSGFDDDINRGMWLFDGANIIKLADQNDAVPGGTNNFNGYSGKGLENGDIAFVGSEQVNFNLGLFHFDGSTSNLTLIANGDTARPDGGTFDRFDGDFVHLKAGVTVFLAEDNSEVPRDIFLWDGLSFERVVGQGDPIPGRTTTFDRFKQTAWDGTRLAFSGEDAAGDEGIYLWDGSSLSLVADTNTQVPGSTETFAQFREVAVTGDRVAFVGERLNPRHRGEVGPTGIFLQANGELFRILDSTQTLDGQTPLSIGISADGMDGNRLAFEFSNFNTDYQAVYVADIAFGADLTISKRDCADPTHPGATVAYLIEAGNNGPVDATSVTVDDLLPAAMSFVDSVPSGLCSETGGLVTCGIGNLASGAGTSFSVIADVDSAADNGVVTNAVTITAAQDDPSTSNDTDTESTTIKGDLIFFDSMERCTPVI